MPGDLFSDALQLRAAGTVTLGSYSVMDWDGVEVFIQGGTAVAGSAVTGTIHIDAQDLDGNWFPDAVGTVIPIGTGTFRARGFRRGINVGATDPAVLGMMQRIRAVVVGGTMEIGVNVIGVE